MMKLFKKPAPVADVKPPLLASVGGFLPEGRSLPEGVQAFIASSAFAELLDVLADWPTNSLVSAHERAVLHWLISETRAKAVLEIGTAFAGTTLLLASSMLQAGKGIVHTIDPYASDRTTATIGAWPTALQDVVRFSKQFSTDVFVPSVEQPPFDLVLIDGNHSYANVMHDIFAAYEAICPGGFIVLDNAEQIDVLDGARDFQRLTPHAELARVALRPTEDGSGVSVETSMEPLEVASAFVLIRKPVVVYITRRALAFHLNRVRNGALNRLEAVIDNPSSSPVRLVGQASLRSLSAVDTRSADLGERFEVLVQPGRHAEVFEFGSLKLGSVVDGDRVFAEVNLATANQDEALVLDSLKLDGFALRPGRNFMKHLP